jgi:hypothetical protein
MKLKKKGGVFNNLEYKKIREEKEKEERERKEEEKIINSFNTITNVGKDILVQAELEIIDTNKLKINSLIINKNILLESVKEPRSESKNIYNINLYYIIKILFNVIEKYSKNSTTKIEDFLSKIGENFFIDISKIVNKYDDNNNFQKGIEGENKPLFPKYELWNKEDSRKFITIDPSIIQIMIFDNIDPDKVYSLKLIKREGNKLTFRYTTCLFPNKSRITDFGNLTDFENFDKELDVSIIDKKKLDKYISFIAFLKKYLKFYDFYKKCYRITNDKLELSPSNKILRQSPSKSKFLVDYQLRYISILGKARFGHNELKKRTAVITDYIMSNLLFMNPTYAFISGGYKGFKDKKYGVTRSGYEIAKRYNRPVLTIMCKEGLYDSHMYSDATYIYGEHWGEDSIALSQFTDGAIIIAPFGGWTYIECLTLLANEKIVGIYNNFYNILNYNKDTALENLNFFDFFESEQDSIINYYINYYLILLFLIKEKTESPYTEIIDCIEFILKLLTYLKTDRISKTNIDEEKYNKILNSINVIKNEINIFVLDKFDEINIIYRQLFDGEYQNNIPENCDGIWIKPSFNLSDCIQKKEDIKKDIKKDIKIDISRCKTDNMPDIDNEFIINYDYLKENKIFNNLNNNIIFVFSNVYYLNIYINKKLNTSEYQSKLQEKINKLQNKNTFIRTISRNLSYNRSLDSSFNEITGDIIDEFKIREKYEFIIGEECKTYKLIDTIDEEPSIIENETQLRDYYINKDKEDKIKEELKQKEIKIIEKYNPELLTLKGTIFSESVKDLTHDIDVKLSSRASRRKIKSLLERLSI